MTESEFGKRRRIVSVSNRSLCHKGNWRRGFSGKKAPQSAERGGEKVQKRAKGGKEWTQGHKDHVQKTQRRMKEGKKGRDTKNEGRGGVTMRTDLGMGG